MDITLCWTMFYQGKHQSVAVHTRFQKRARILTSGQHLRMLEEKEKQKREKQKALQRRKMEREKKKAAKIAQGMYLYMSPLL